MHRKAMPAHQPLEMPGRYGFHSTRPAPWEAGRVASTRSRSGSEAPEPGPPPLCAGRNRRRRRSATPGMARGERYVSVDRQSKGGVNFRRTTRRCFSVWLSRSGKAWEDRRGRAIRHPLIPRRSTQVRDGRRALCRGAAFDLRCRSCQATSSITSSVPLNEIASPARLPSNSA